MEFWRDFKGETWKEEINVSEFIDNNYTEYVGDDCFLADISEKTAKISEKPLVYSEQLW